MAKSTKSKRPEVQIMDVSSGIAIPRQIDEKNSWYTTVIRTNAYTFTEKGLKKAWKESMKIFKAIREQEIQPVKEVKKKSSKKKSGRLK